MKILLLTDIPPTLDLTAGIFLESMINNIPKEKIVCYAVLNKGIKPRLTDKAIGIPLEIVTKPRENWGNRVGGSTISLFIEPIIAYFIIPGIVRKIIKFALTHSVDRIWVTLQGQTMIRIAYLLSMSVDIPIYSQVYDPPQWWMRSNKVNPIIARSVYKLFKKTLKKSKNCAMASWAMVDYYNKLYGVTGVPMVFCVDDSLGKIPAKSYTSNNHFIICMAGQLYASKEWHSLLNALDQLNWKINGKDVVVRYLGGWLQIDANKPRHIEYLGWRTLEEVISIASESDLCYCPYWFDPNFELVAMLSFPSKLPIYFSSGRPVLFHGPSYSSPYKFAAIDKAIFTCESLDPTEIAKKLFDISSQITSYVSTSKNAHTLFINELTNIQLKQRVVKFLDLDELSIN